MAIHEDLIYFLKNGKFRNINFGITKREFVEILGEPEFENSLRNSISWLEYDDNFEFYFWQEIWKQQKVERLLYVGIKNLKKATKNSKFHFESYNWNSKLTLEEALEFFKRYEIKFEEMPYVLDEDWKQIKTEGNVVIWFINLEEIPQYTFYKISREVELSPFKPPTKQISFEIEKTYYEQLRTEAEKTKISIANLCREIIEKHLEKKQ